MFDIFSGTCGENTILKLPRSLLCVMRTHVFGPNFQGKKSFLKFKYAFIYLYLDTCFLYYKGILAFIFEHIMAQEILWNK